MTDNHHPSSLSDTSFLPELPDSPDILEGLDKTLELLDAARTARRTELLSGRMFFPSYTEKANQLPTLYRNAKKSLSPLLRELWLLPAQFRVSQSGAVKFGDIAEKTHFDVVIALGKQTIRFLFHAIVLSRSVDQQTMNILRDQEERDELPNFDFGADEADRENVSTLIRDLPRIPNGDWEQLKSNVELEAINLQRWRGSGPEDRESVNGLGGRSGLESRTWQEVLPELEQLMQDDHLWLGYREMAKLLKCKSDAPIRNAIKNGTVELLEWTTKQYGPSRKLASPEESEHGFRSVPQQRERDPSDVVESADVERITQHLVAETTRRHGKEQGKRLQADIDAGKFNETKLTRMADVYLNDPDEDDQARKYKILADQVPRQED